MFEVGKIMKEQSMGIRPGLRYARRLFVLYLVTLVSATAGFLGLFVVVARPATSIASALAGAAAVWRGRAMVEWWRRTLAAPVPGGHSA